MTPSTLRPGTASVGWLARIARRRRAMIGLAILCFPAASLGIGGTNGSAAVRSLLADPLSVFADRSPGVRGVGELAQTKMPFEQAAAWPQEARVTGAGFNSPSSGDGELPLLETAAGAFDETSSNFNGMFLIDDATAAFSESGGFSASPLFLDVFSGEGPDDGFIGRSSAALPNPSFPALPPAIASVPEPGVWLTMITGFFSIGLAKRRLHQQVGLPTGMLSIGPSDCVKH